MAEYVHVEGLRGVVQTLKQLPPEIVSKRGGPVRAALRKAALVIQREAQGNVRRIVAQPNVGGEESRSTGALEAAIGVRRLPETTTGGNGEAFAVSVNRLTKAAIKKLTPTGEKPRPAFYMWFLELGTERMQAHPFMRPAYEARKGEAVNVMVSELQAALRRILRKLQRQNRVKT